MNWFLLYEESIIITSTYTLDPLSVIYTVQQAYDRPTTQIVSCKPNLQLPYDCHVHDKKCRTKTCFKILRQS